MEFYENSQSPERALLIGVDTGEYNAEISMEELALLSETAGAEIIGTVIQKLEAPSPATYIGSGRMAEVAAFCRNNDIDLIIADSELTPSQINNIETKTDTRVVDRTMLILDIFAARARSSEGKLQVELAQLKYSLPFLSGRGKSMSRLGGGIGTRGPGESKLESDKRHIRRRIHSLSEELKRVEKRRDLIRSRRKKDGVITVAIVGYTNAGKSTLFNRMTGADVMAENLLFATLDPTMRQISLPGIDKAILSDTVGFVSDLPTELVAAFRATLEEVTTADLIVHVRDIVHPDSDAQYDDVRAILDSLGVNGPRDGEGEDAPDAVPQIEIWNKIDTADADRRAQIEEMAARRPDVAIISAVSGEGVEAARALMASQLTAQHKVERIFLRFDQGEAMAWLHARGEVLSDLPEGEGHVLTVRLDPADRARFERLWPPSVA